MLLAICALAAGPREPKAFGAPLILELGDRQVTVTGYPADVMAFMEAFQEELQPGWHRDAPPDVQLSARLCWSSGPMLIGLREEENLVIWFRTLRKWRGELLWQRAKPDEVPPPPLFAL